MANKHLVLIIDTATSDSTRVAVDIDGQRVKKTADLNQKKPQAVLPLILKLISENKLDFKDVSAISVNPGPGSFTGLRVGLAVANMLGKLLDIPANGQRDIV